MCIRDRPQLAGMNICAYNPDLDPDGSYGKLLIDLIVESLEQRIAPPAERVPTTEPVATAESSQPADQVSEAPVSSIDAAAEASEAVTETTTAAASPDNLSEEAARDTEPASSETANPETSIP